MIFHGGFQKHVVALLATSKTTGKILYGNPYRAATFVLKSKTPGKRRDALILNIIAYVVQAILCHGFESLTDRNKTM